MFENRFTRNGTTVTPEETKLLGSKKAFVAGCGGLGGYILEMLLRVGVGSITAADPDVFDESNLNRQLLSSEELMGASKAQTAVIRAGSVNSEVIMTGYPVAMTAENAAELIGDADIVMDALDSPEARLVLEKAAEEKGIPLIHGAIAGWYGQVSAVFPGDRTLSTLYADQSGGGIETELGNPSFTPAVIAGVQVAEAVKVLLNKGDILRHKLLYLDLLGQSHTVLDLKS